MHCILCIVDCSDLKLLEQAKNYAKQKHDGQLYNKYPYTHHLEDVAKLLEPYGIFAQVIGYLHDVIEDTDATVGQVEEIFGPLVAKAVSVLSDQPGKNRKERKQKTYALMKDIEGDLEIALQVKAADRLANVRSCLEFKLDNLFKMYQSEYSDFKDAVYRPGLCEPLWIELESLMHS